MRHSTSRILTGTMLLLLLAGPALGERRPPVSASKTAGDLVTVAQQDLAPLNNAALTAEAEQRASERIAAPYEFARPRPVALDLESSGTWETLGDGSRLWRLRIVSPDAVHLNLGFSRFDLPAGAALWIYGPSGADVHGPYTARDRSDRGRLFTPIVSGDTVVVELHVPAGAEGALDVRVGSVNHGFRGFAAKGLSGDCNNDVICPEGDPWRDQIRSEARYTINGSTLCSGQMVNNTAQDDTPYFLSAFHCGVTASNDDTLVVYWNYESPVCGQRGGGSLQDNQSGAIYRASEPTTDFLLVELVQMPRPDSDVFYTGWDVSGRTPQGSVCIHHPAGDVKAISFNDDPLGMREWIEPNTHWEVDDWEDGTTEGGSSGSCLYDPANKLCIGVLTAGLASCSVIDFDIFGKLSLAWNVGNTAATRLRDWLDPLGTGATTLAGRDQGALPPPPGDCAPSATVMCLQNNRFRVQVSATGADGPRPATVVPFGNPDSGLFWFFSPDNWEMLIKVLDGCNINDRYWVFAASATAVEWTITVTDTQENVTEQYFNPPGMAAPAITDTAAFATCP